MVLSMAGCFEERRKGVSDIKRLNTHGFLVALKNPKASAEVSDIKRLNTHGFVGRTNSEPGSPVCFRYKASEHALFSFGNGMTRPLQQCFRYKASEHAWFLVQQ